jgi:uncharacterized membrane protein YbhN (UPF0104 family)
MYKNTKRILGLVIVIATIALFVWYLTTHPAVVDQLKNTSPATVVALLILYFGVQLILALVLVGSLSMYNKRLSRQENFLLNAYSSLVNFFGPGQSGPGFRTLYLKAKHGVGVKQYIFVTLIYYTFYAVFSGVLLLAFTLAWWQTALVSLAIGAGCIGIMRLYVRKNGDQKVHSKLLVRAVAIIGLATILQVAIMSVIYYIELHSLDANVTFTQAAAYSGAANFAIFVALTPGAIGIREAFLFSTEKIHGIPQDLIVAANVLDRAVYVVFLGILFLFVLGMHANKKLAVKEIQQDSR